MMNPFLSVSDSGGIKGGAGDSLSPSLSSVQKKFQHEGNSNLKNWTLMQQKSEKRVPEFFKFCIKIFPLEGCLRPYHLECTSSRPITEVKQGRDLLVLGWVTAWEYRLLQTFCIVLPFVAITLTESEPMGEAGGSSGHPNPLVRCCLLLQLI